LESIEINAYKFYSTAPVNDGKAQPFEIIESRLREAYNENTAAKKIREALFVDSFPNLMVRSFSQNDTDKRLYKVNEIQKNSESLVKSFLESPTEYKEEKLGNVLAAASELRETIPVTRRINLNREKNNSWTESVSTSSTTSKSSGFGRGNY
jgi:hypothetical protein